MFPTLKSIISSLASVALILSALSLNATAQQSQLGKVVFPSSGSAKATLPERGEWRADQLEGSAVSARRALKRVQ